MGKNPAANTSAKRPTDTRKMNEHKSMCFCRAREDVQRACFIVATAAVMHCHAQGIQRGFPYARDPITDPDYGEFFRPPQTTPTHPHLVYGMYANSGDVSNSPPLEPELRP